MILALTEENIWIYLRPITVKYGHGMAVLYMDTSVWTSA